MPTLRLLPLVVAALCLAGAATARSADEAPPLTAVQAREKVGQEISVQFVVQAAKNRLEKRGEIYLDAETDFRDPQNFAVVITRAGAALFQSDGVDDPAEKFMSQTIRVKGTVKIVQEVPRIEIDDPKQIEIVKPQ